MSTAKEHYEKHLGSFYSWMIGDFETSVKNQIEVFQKYNILKKERSLALDL